jgi:hypothetical protein
MVVISDVVERPLLVVGSSDLGERFRQDPAARTKALDPSDGLTSVTEFGGVDPAVGCKQARGNERAGDAE